MQKRPKYAVFLCKTFLNLSFFFVTLPEYVSSYWRTAFNILFFMQYILSALSRTATCLQQFVSCQQNTTRDTLHSQYVISYLQSTFRMLLSSTTRLRHTVSWLSKHPKMICPLQNVSKFAIISLQYVLSVLYSNKTPHNVAHYTLSMSFLTCNTPSACYVLPQYVLAILFPGCQNTER